MCIRDSYYAVKRNAVNASYKIIIFMLTFFLDMCHETFNYTEYNHKRSYKLINFLNFN